MKNFVLIVFFFLTFSGHSQTKNSTTKNSKFSSQTVQNLVHALKHDTCLDKKFSIVVYLIQDSIYSLPSSLQAMISYSLTHIMNELNGTFSKICVSFEHCKTVIIPNFSYNEWDVNSVGKQVISNYYTENTINLYIPDVIKDPLPDDPDAAYTPGLNADTLSFRNAIVLAKGAGPGYQLLHVFGHFFGLPHTYEEINPGNVPSPPPPGGIVTYEYADRSDLNNCYTHGDGFCDTEADPYSSINVFGDTLSSSGNCVAQGVRDGKGNFYIPPTDNFMSRHFCRCRFSQEQYNYMARYIARNRMYLH